MSIRVAVITPASMNRLDHLQRQRRFLTEAVSYTHLTLPTKA